MGVPGTTVKVQDVAFGAIGERRSHENLPAVMVCKHGHSVTKNTVSTGSLTIPFYLCGSCEVVFRYHECTKTEDAISSGLIGEDMASM